MGSGGSGEGQGLGTFLELSAHAIGISPTVDQPPSPVHATIPPVLDGVVASSIQSSRNLGPSLAHLVHQSLDEDAFFWGDGVMAQGRFEVLVESLPTLLGRPRSDQHRYSDPVVSSLCMDQLEQA